MSEVGDRVPKPAIIKPNKPLMPDLDKANKQHLLDSRPRIISVTAVENVLTELGCIACGVPQPPQSQLKHRPGCLYLAYARARDDAEKATRRAGELTDVVAEVRMITNSALRRNRA